MKAKVFLRIGQMRSGKLKIVGGSRPCYDALLGTAHLGTVPVLPTLAFAVEIEFPDALLRQAEQVAAKINIEKKDAVVCGTVLSAKAK